MGGGNAAEPVEVGESNLENVLGDQLGHLHQLSLSGEGIKLSVEAVCVGDRNKGGGNFCSSWASEGGAEAIGANLNQPFKLGLWQHFF